MVTFIVLSAIGMVLMPERVWWWNITSRFIGIWGHPNTTGIFCMSAYPVLLWKFNESNNYNKILIAGLFIFVIFMHIVTGSRTSLLAAVIGVSAWFILQKQAVKVVAGLAVIGIFVFALLQFKPSSFERMDSQDITSTTGRDEMWTGAITMIKEKPFTGYGYSVEGKIWEDPRFFKKGYDLWSGSNRTSLHNGYLSITVGVGLIGLLLWLTILFTPLFKVFKADKDFYKSFAISVMVMLFLANMAESTLNSGNTIGGVFFWLAWVISGKLNDFKREQGSYEEEDAVLEKNYAA